MNPTRQQIVSIHEAGHAVVAEELGLHVKSVEFTDGGGGGLCQIYEFQRGLVTDFDAATVYAAGLMAASYKFGVGCEGAPRVDMKGLRGLPREQAIRAIERASEILRRRWADVESLAIRLHDDGEGFLPIPFAPDYENQ